MRMLALAFTPRFIVLTLCILATLLLALAIGGSMLSRWDIPLGAALAVFAGLSLLGLRDLTQTRHAILRNYPISAHLRFLLEEMRPEMRQYFFESEKRRPAVPARPARDRLPARQDGARQAAVRHAARRLRAGLRMAAAIRSRRGRSPTAPFRISVGGPDCAQPYSASVFNISAMSFGSLSANAIRALNARREDRRLRA